MKNNKKVANLKRAKNVMINGLKQVLIIKKNALARSQEMGNVKRKK